MLDRYALRVQGQEPIVDVTLACESLGSRLPDIIDYCLSCH